MVDSERSEEVADLTVGLIMADLWSEFKSRHCVSEFHLVGFLTASIEQTVRRMARRRCVSCIVVLLNLDCLLHGAQSLEQVAVGLGRRRGWLFPLSVRHDLRPLLSGGFLHRVFRLIKNVVL